MTGIVNSGISPNDAPETIASIMPFASFDMAMECVATLQYM